MMYFFLSLLLPMFSTMSLAVPSAFTSKCGALVIENQTSSTLIRDHEDCKAIWVLPPALGTVAVSGYTSNANLLMCRDVKEVQTLSHSLSLRINSVLQEQENLGPTRREKTQAVAEAKRHVFAIETLPEIKEILKQSDRLDAIDRKIEGTYESLAKCTITCEALSKKLEELKNEKIDVADRLAILRDRHYELHSKYRDAQAELESVTYALQHIEDHYDSLQTKITSLKLTMQQWLLTYSRFEGGTAHLSYNTQWTDNVAKLNKKYKGVYEFKPVPTRNARFAAQFVGANDKDTYLGSMPAILDYVIAGVKFTPWGERGAVENTSFPDRIGGSIRLSLMGGCPLYYKNFLDSDTLEKNDSLANNLGFSINATYEYPAAFKFNVTARYNLYKFYERMAQATNNGGFFSRESYSDLMETQHGDDVFTIKWDDESSMYTTKEKDEIQKTIKTELTSQVLAMMASPLFSSTHDIKALTPTSTTHGALVIADGLNETCGYFNIFCQGGVWLLRGLDATFGSDTSKERFKANQNYVAEQRWSRSEAQWRSAASGFVYQ